MKKILIWFLVFIVEWTTFIWPSYAFASPAVNPTSTTAIINKIIQGTPGIQNVIVAGSATVSAAGTATAVTAEGIAIPVGVTAAGGVTAARVAGIAAGVAKIGTAVGVVSILAPWILENSGYKVCPPPDFFCKKGPDSAVPPNTGGYSVSNGTGGSYIGSSGDIVCGLFFQNSMSSTQKTQAGGLIYVQRVPLQSPIGYCQGSSNGTLYVQVYSSTPVCPVGSYIVNGGCFIAGPDVPVPQAEIQNIVSTKVSASPQSMADMFNAIRSAGYPVFLDNDPVAVTASPATSAPLTSTETIANPDGSTSTKLVTTVAAVNPVVTGGTMTDTKISYPTTTTTTTSITNNITHETISTTKTVTETATVKDEPYVPPVVPQVPLPENASQVPKVDFPTDYNREVTQQAILKSLDGTGVPSASTVDKDADLAKIADQNSKIDPAIAGITAGSVGIVSWFPTVPVAACVNPMVPTPITGVMRTVEICEPVSVFSKFISAVICCFALFGCVRSVQSAIKA